MASDFSVQTRITAVPNQVSTNLSGEEVILHLDTGVYFGLDPIGSRIWSLLQQTNTVGAICAVICDEYDVDPVECQQDIQQFLQQLAEAQLIEVQHELAEQATTTR